MSGGSSYGGIGGAAPGTAASGVSNPETLFMDLRLGVQLVADATVAPGDAPAVDTVRMVRDAAGKRFEWSWSATEAAWKGVELTA